MNYQGFYLNKLKSEAGFSLLEMLLVITISSLLLAIFINTALVLYQDYNFFNLQNAWQLDLHLAADFITSQIQNSQKIELINEQEINIYSYYQKEYQWLKFSQYISKKKNNLGRAIGSNKLKPKDFGRNLSLLDNIKSLSFKIPVPGLLELKITAVDGEQELTVSRLININKSR